MTQHEGQFGRYQLLDRIATGGMAEIYRARYQAAAGVTKMVVIKKILPHYAGNKNFVAMFINEAKIAVGLSHGNIAQVFDFGEIDGEYFLAMEFVHGQPLSRVLRKAKTSDMPVMPPPVAVAVAMEMCKGLHYAHTRLDERGQPLNIIHRDVSPQNLILAYEGQVKIVDFGIAKARNAGQMETESGAVKGKYVYFSPEQARGREVDARTDVFAAGVVLYEMLCGKLPFEGKMMDVLGRILRGDFPRPRALNPDITPPLERIVLTAMANDKASRYATAQAFQDALASYLYSSAPTFSSSSLEALMGYLFEKELVDEGFPVKIPPNFMQQLATWRIPPPFDDEDESTRSDKPSAKARTVPGPARSSRGGIPPPPAAEPRAQRSNPAPAPTVESARPPRHALAETAPGVEPVITLVPSEAPVSVIVERQPRERAPRPEARSAVTRPGAVRPVPRWLFAAAPLAALLVSAGVVYALGAMQDGLTLEITSDPKGAVVLVDGKPGSQTTPVRISGLPRGEHRIELQMPGMKPWSRKVASQKRAALKLDARLEPSDGTAHTATSPAP